MAKEICISSTPHETRLAILEDDQLAEIYYERENEYTLAGSIYKGRVTRVLPGMQSAFVDVGLERDAFLYVTDFMEEQEDGADFEKVGPPAPRREGGNQPRESREPREARQQRSASVAIEAPAARDDQATVGPKDEPAGEEEFQQGGGTRRWRGRRGRRRGVRPGGPRESSSAAPQATTSAAEDQSWREGAPAIEISAAREEETFEEPLQDARRAPRPAANAATGAAPATIVLPGEALQKYGHKPSDAEPEKTVSDSAAAAPRFASKVTFVAPKPSTLVEVPTGWDGGLLMPGETLSRYRNQPAAELKPQAAVLETETVDTSTAEELVPSMEEGAAVHLQNEAAAVAETPVEETQESIHATVDEAHEAALESHAMVAASEPEVAAAPAVEAHEVEEEPETASASHRVDPSAPSEFRLASPVFDEPVVEETVVVAPSAEHHETAAVEPVAEAAAEHHDADHHVEAHHEAVAEKHEPVALLPAHATETVEEAPAHQHDLHELHAAHVEEATPVEEIADEDEGEEESVDSIEGFAPGIGVLEEEVIDEEEYDFAPLHLMGDEHDLDELEEETLDQQMGGTELGEMVREAHMDHRVHVALGTGVPTEEEADEETEQSAADLAEDEAYEEDFSEESTAVEGEPATNGQPAPRRRTDDGRRGGRGRSGRTGRGGRDSRGGGRGRQNTQASDLPIISDLLKQGQEILVQIAKEPIAKKGARITSHIALPGRFLVFMPTVNHVGVSRKIAADDERQRLKRILISEKGEASGGFIVRTAAAHASEEELRADLRFLISLWNEIKTRSDAGKAPALIYHDLNLVERILRDQVSDNFSSIWVDSETEYERIVRFLQRFQPSLVRRVKLYTKETPLFEQFGIQEEITKALKSKVWLKSGGSIVINQTEALVAIDINTGKYVGKTARLEDTILKTNLDAIPEIVRQIRLRDLGGIIVIDFIDMDERKNRNRVMQALEEALKADRAPSKVLQFNDFGLVAITRKRVKQSLERTLSVQCSVCTGTGMVKSPITVCNEIYVELRKMVRHIEGNDILLRVNPEVVKTLKGNNARWLTEMEELISKNIIVKSDPTLPPEEFDIQ